MKRSRVIIRAGSILLAIAVWIMAASQHVAIWIGGIGERLSHDGFVLMCNGH